MIKKIVLGVASISEWFLAYYLIRLVHVSATGIDYSLDLAYINVIQTFLLVSIIVISIALVTQFIYMKNVYRNRNIKVDQKLLWGLLILFLGYIVMPVYWYLHIWREDPIIDKTDKSKLPAIVFIPIIELIALITFIFSIWYPLTSLYIKSAEVLNRNLIRKNNITLIRSTLDAYYENHKNYPQFEPVSVYDKRFLSFFKGTDIEMLSDPSGDNGRTCYNSKGGASYSMYLIQEPDVFEDHCLENAPVGSLFYGVSTATESEIFTETKKKFEDMDLGIAVLYPETWNISNPDNQIRIVSPTHEEGYIAFVHIYKGNRQERFKKLSEWRSALLNSTKTFIKILDSDSIILDKRSAFKITYENTKTDTTSISIYVFDETNKYEYFIQLDVNSGGYLRYKKTLEQIYNSIGFI